MTAAAAGPEVRHEADEVLLGFTRALRQAGVPVTHDRAASYLQAAALVRLDGPAADRPLRHAGHATLCASPDDLARHDQVFDAWFDHRTGLPRSRPAAPGPAVPTSLPEQDGGEGTGSDDEEVEEVLHARASDVEVLRHRDVAALSPAERQRLAALLARLTPRPPLRRTRRHQRWHRGEVDARATLRASLRRMGEPSDLRRRRRRVRPRRVVLLIDVSGSMSAYADVLLRVAHRMVAAAPATTEVFTLGTRLTHLTRPLRLPDVERALVAAGAVVPDWSGGTRLGESLGAFVDRWGRRGLARGAVVVVLSDGWERGDAALLGEQAARLRRLAHRVVWVNPHRGKAGYEAVQQGVLAVLPHVDDFLAGHSLATYAALCEVVADA